MENLYEKEIEEKLRRAMFGDENKIGYLLGYFCALTGIVALITAVYYSWQGIRRKALQAFIVPFANWGLFFILKDWDDQVHFFKSVFSAGLVLFIVFPLLSVFLVTKLSPAPKKPKF